MKIKLNEIDKIDTTFRVACSLTAIDMLLEGLGMLAIIELLSKTKQSLINNELDEFVQNMEKLGVKKDKLVSTLTEYLKDSENHNE